MIVGTLLLSGVFLGYLLLLIYCDTHPPVALGISTASSSDAIRDSTSAPAGLVVTHVFPGSPADRAGIRTGDRILAIDGRRVGDRLDWLAMDANIEIGQPRRFVLERSRAHLDITITPTPANWEQWRSQGGLAVLSVRLIQVVALAVAAFVALKRSGDPVAVVGALFLGTIGVFSVTLPFRLAFVWRALPAPIGLALWLPFVNSAALAAWLCAFFACFPRRRLHTPWGWALLWLPLVPGLAGHAKFGYFMLYHGAPAPRLAFWPAATLLSASIGYVIAGLTILVLNYRRLTDVNERRRIRVVMAGCLIGSLGGVPVAVSYWESLTSSVERSFLASPWTMIGTLLFLFIPFSFAYAILRHRLFDIRIMIRQGVRYGFARHAVLSLAPIGFIIAAADMLAHGDEPLAALIRTRVWVYGTAAAVVAVARARRGVWLDSLDRRFFRERYNAQLLLREIAEDVRATDSFERIALRVVSEIERALHPSFTAILRLDAATSTYRALACADSRMVAAPADAAPSAPAAAAVESVDPLSSGNKAIALVELLGQPLELSANTDWLEKKLPSSDLEALQSAGIDLLVPIAATAWAMDMLLALGAKRSEEPYTQDDCDLLMAIAGSIALRAYADRRRSDDAREPSDSARFEECPACGLCHDAGTATCGNDGSALVTVHLPRMLGDRYKLARRLGRGGMGLVYAGLDTALDRRIAVKLIREELVGAPGAADRFRREARTAASFAHPHVVTIHDFGLAGDTHAFLVMELLEGRTLRGALEQEGRMSPGRALSIVRGVVSAVDAAHRRRLIHRDLKPENIFLVGLDQGNEAAADARDGSKSYEVAKVLDFGVATFLASGNEGVEARLTSGAIPGTVLYMAPEQLRGEAPHESWDLWALAVITYEMLTGRHPFAGGSGDPQMVHPSGTPIFFARALAVDPAQRPASAVDFLEELEAALASRDASGQIT